MLSRLLGSARAKVGGRAVVEACEPRRLMDYAQQPNMPVVVDWAMDSYSTSGSPRTSTDVSGYGNTLSLTLGTAATVVTGRVGSAIRFGSGAFTSGSDTFTTPISGSFTASLWVNPTSSAVAATLAAGTYAAGTGWSLGMNTSRAVTFTMGAMSLTTTATLPLNTWSQVAVVVRHTPGGTSSAEVFVNGGTGATTNATTGVVTDVTSQASGSVTLASSPGTATLTVGSSLTGSLDQVRLFSVPLSDSAVWYGNRVDSIQESDGTSANTGSWLLAKAVLDWSLENAILAEASADAFLQPQATLDYQDIVAGLSRGTNLFQIGALNPVAGQYRFLYPTMDRTAANGAYTASQNDITSLVNTQVRFAKNNTDAAFTSGDALTSSEDLVELAWALGDPDNTTWNRSPALAKAVLRRLQKHVEELAGGTFVADFGMSDGLVETYWMLNATFPNLIGPSRKAWTAAAGTQTYSQAVTANVAATPHSWATQLRFNAEMIANSSAYDLANTPGQPQYTSNLQRFLSGNVNTTWWNADIRLLEALLWTQYAFGVTSYRAGVDVHFQTLKATTFADGAQAYVWNQTDVVSYHLYNTESLARMMMVGTGVGSAGIDPAMGQVASDLLAASAWYFPLSVEPWGQGVAEHSTVTPWKHYWNTNNGSEQASIVAWVAAGRGNTNAANGNNVIANLALNGSGGIGPGYISATYWTRAASLPGGGTWTPTRAASNINTGANNFIAYDANIAGARGRFGTFSFATNGANVAGPSVTGSSMGKSNFVGAMMIDSASTNSWPLSAALDTVAVRVQTSTALVSGVTDVDNATYADRAFAERTATTVFRDFSALSTNYIPAVYNQTSNQSRTTWTGQQDWLTTSNQVAGVLSLSGAYASGQFGVSGVVKLVSGRNSWGVTQTLTEVTGLAATVSQANAGMRVWRYGNMMVAVQPLAGVNTSAIHTGSTFTWAKTDSPQKAHQIILPDLTAASTATRTAGTAVTLRYTVQTYPADMTRANPSTTPVPGTLATATLTGLPDATSAALTGSLTRTDLTEGGVTRRLLSNPAGTGSLNLVYTLPVSDAAFPNGAIVYSSGERFIPAGSRDTTGLGVTLSDFRGVPGTAGYQAAYYVAPGGTLTVPANAHVVLVRPTAPTVSVPVATPAPVTGTTVGLSAVGADAIAESQLRYTWNVVGVPPAPVTLPVMNTNGAKSVTATFARAGAYTFNVTVTNPAGLSTTSSNVVVNVNQTATSISLTPGSATLGLGGQAGLSAVVRDQFGLAMSSQPSVAFTVQSGGGAVAATGPGAATYTAPAVATSAVVRAASGAIFSTSAITVQAPPALSSWALSSTRFSSSGVVSGVALNFSSPVTLGVGAVTVLRRGAGGVGTGTPVAFSLVSSAGGRTWTVRFPGGLPTLGAMYDLLLTATGVTDAVGQALTGGDRVITFGQTRRADDVPSVPLTAVDPGDVPGATLG